MFTVLCRHGNIYLSLTLKKKTTCYMYKHIVEIPTNKGVNSYKLKKSKIGNCT